MTAGPKISTALVGDKKGVLTIIEELPRTLADQRRVLVQNQNGLKKVMTVQNWRSLSEDTNGKRGRPRLAPKDQQPIDSYALYKNNAQIRGVPFDLRPSEVEAAIKDQCVYCGDRPAIVSLNDSVLGYVPSNIAPACAVCDDIKGNRSPAEFIAWVERIVALHPH